MSLFRHLDCKEKAILHTFHEVLRNDGSTTTPLASRFQSEIIDKLEDDKPEFLIEGGRRILATDGSLQKHSALKSCGAGAAVFTVADSRINKAVSLPITDNISILTAESVAILAGLAVSTRENFHRILIVSDSKTAVDKFNALKDGAYNKHVAARIGTTPLERRIWTEIGKLARVLNVVIRHIRSHQKGDQSPLMKLNQKADDEAKGLMKRLLQQARADDGLALHSQ